jgi:hypothetical protein
MSTFGDQLRQSLASKEDGARDAGQRYVQNADADAARFTQAEAAAAGLVEEVLAPLVAEFHEVMEAQNVLCRGRTRLERPGRFRPDHGQLRLFHTARGTARGQRRYEIRLHATLGRAGSVELWAECVRDASPGGIGAPRAWQPITVLPRTRLLAAVIDEEAAREWCEGVLKLCAEALIEANFAGGTAAGVPAPVCAPLDAIGSIVPAMSFEM